MPHLKHCQIRQALEAVWVYTRSGQVYVIVHQGQVTENWVTDSVLVNLHDLRAHRVQVDGREGRKATSTEHVRHQMRKHVATQHKNSQRRQADVSGDRRQLVVLQVKLGQLRKQRLLFPACLRKVKDPVSTQHKDFQTGHRRGVELVRDLIASYVETRQIDERLKHGHVERPDLDVVDTESAEARQCVTMENVTGERS